MNTSVIIVGSGASAVSAAWPLVEAGIQVTTLDLGTREDHYSSLIPKRSFSDIRYHESDQHRYFLGEHFEGVQFDDVTVGAQLTPPRQYISALTETLTPTRSSSFFFMESLAAGGLASGWGAGCFPYSEKELADFYLSRSELEPHYSAVANRIGVSGCNDDLIPFYGEAEYLQPSLNIDANAQSILEKYQSNARRYRSNGFTLGYPRLAVLSQPLRARPASRYYEMEFWADLDQSVYRPTFTLEELKKKQNFQYRERYLVERFEENNDGVIIHAFRPSSKTREQFSCSTAILAAGTFGTARIVLRSFNQYDRTIPIVSNPYTYVPMVNLSRLGKTDDASRYSLTQLCAVYQSDPDEAILHAQLYSYRSLLNYKLIKEIPLPYRTSMEIVRMLLSSFCILGIHHEDRPSSEKYCLLRKGTAGTPDVLQIEFALDVATEQRQNYLELQMLKSFRKLGCYSLKKIRNGNGSSIHYGGTFPITPHPAEMTVTKDCLLRPTKRVYIADGSVFPYLPAKGPTFTMMANANRVGSYVRDHLLHG